MSINVVSAAEFQKGNRGYGKGNRGYGKGNRDYGKGNRDYGKGNRDYEERCVSRPTRTTPGALIGIYFRYEDGKRIAVMNAGEHFKRDHYYKGFVSDNHWITVLIADKQHEYGAIMPQNLYKYRSNVVFSAAKAQENAPTEQGVAFVVLYANEEDVVRHKAANVLQAAVRGFLSRCYQRKQTEAAVCIQRAVRSFLAVKRVKAASEAAAKAEADAEKKAVALAQYQWAMAQQYNAAYHLLLHQYNVGVFGTPGSILADAQYRTALLELIGQADNNGLSFF